VRFKIPSQGAFENVDRTVDYSTLSTFYYEQQEVSIEQRLTPIPLMETTSVAQSECPTFSPAVTPSTKFTEQQFEVSGD